MNVSYTLTSIEPIACHGTSFQSLLEAINYAEKSLQPLGLCKKYSVGEYSYDGHKEIYRNE
jgi:hypothetical protein